MISATARKVLLLSERTHPNPLHGRLEVKNGLVHDATGPRRVMFSSDFCLQRMVGDHPTEAARTLDLTAAVGRQGVRFCYAGPSEDEERYPGFPPHPEHGYWWQRVATPSQAKERLIPTLRMLDERDLYAHIFGSFNFDETGREGATREIAFHEWMGATIRKEGLAHRIFYEWRNEWNLTSPYGGGWNEEHDTFGSDETYRVAAACIAIMRRELGCPCTMGSPGEEDPSIAETVTRAGGNIAAIDFGRGMSGDLMMKHAHRAYYDGRYKGRYKGAALWVTEPAGPDSPGLPNDSYEALNDPAYLFGMHATYALTGQAASYFSDPSVRHWQPLEQAIGFTEHPKLFQFFPEDIGRWTGPTWFRNPNNAREFYTVVAEEWYLLEHPPAPFKRWTLLFHDGKTVEGTAPKIDTDVLAPSWKACAVNGEFA